MNRFPLDSAVVGAVLCMAAGVAAQSNSGSAGLWVKGGRLGVHLAWEDSTRPQTVLSSFNAPLLVGEAKKAGAEYITFTVRDAAGSRAFPASVKPTKQDLVAQVVSECHRQRLRICLKYFIGPSASPESVGRELKKLLSSYGRIDALWVDSTSWSFDPEPLLISAGRLQPEVIIKRSTSVEQSKRMMLYVPALSEQGLTKLPSVQQHGEQVVRLPLPGDDHYLVRAIVQVISRGQSALLRVPIGTDGRFATKANEQMRILSKWMFTHGHTLTATTPGPFERLPFFGCTAVEGSRLFVFLFQQPDQGEVRLPRLTTLPVSARLLEGGKSLNVKTSGRDVVLTGIPVAGQPFGVSVVEVDLAGEPKVDPLQLAPDVSGTLVLRAQDAELSSPLGWAGVRATPSSGTVVLDHWSASDETATWQFLSSEAGQFEVSLRCSNAEEPVAASLWIGERRTSCLVPVSSSGNVPVGAVMLHAGPSVVRLRVDSDAPQLAVESVVLKRLPSSQGEVASMDVTPAK